MIDQPTTANMENVAAATSTTAHAAEAVNLTVQATPSEVAHETVAPVETDQRTQKMIDSLNGLQNAINEHSSIDALRVAAAALTGLFGLLDQTNPQQNAKYNEVRTGLLHLIGHATR